MRRKRPEAPEKLVEFLKEEQYHLGVLLRSSLKSAKDRTNSSDLKELFESQARRIGAELGSVEAELESLTKKKKRKK